MENDSLSPTTQENRARKAMDEMRNEHADRRTKKNPRNYLLKFAYRQEQLKRNTQMALLRIADQERNLKNLNVKMSQLTKTESEAENKNNEIQLKVKKLNDSYTVLEKEHTEKTVKFDEIGEHIKTLDRKIDYYTKLCNEREIAVDRMKCESMRMEKMTDESLNRYNELKHRFHSIVDKENTMERRLTHLEFWLSVRHSLPQVRYKYSVEYPNYVKLFFFYTISCEMAIPIPE